MQLGSNSAPFSIFCCFAIKIDPLIFLLGRFKHALSAYLTWQLPLAELSQKLNLQKCYWTTVHITKNSVQDGSLVFGLLSQNFKTMKFGRAFPCKFF